MRNESNKWLNSALLGSFIYLVHTVAGYSQTQSQNVPTVVLASASTVAAIPAGSRVWDGQHQTPDDERLALLWNNLLRLISLHDGYVDYIDFERNIGARYIPGLGTNDAGVDKWVRYYTFYKTGSNWSPSAKLTYRFLEDPTIISLSTVNFILRKYINDPCLMKSSAVVDLEKYGWKMRAQSESSLVLGNASNSRDKIYITTTKVCVTSLVVYGLKK